MADIETSLKEAMTIGGALGVALVDYGSGLTLGVMGGGPQLDMNIAAAGNTDVIRAKVRTMEMLGLAEGIEDMMITLDSQIHVIRLLKSMRQGDAFFLYLALDKARANLGLARHQLRRIENNLEI